jgi:DNA (cytosine-5)-methyltransferase 1
MKVIKAGSDFSGVGAFDQALKRLGINYKTIFACDMDKYARQTYMHNYGEPKYYPLNVYDRDIPSESLDIYMTSPPCQAFSLAGKRLGKEDKRGILFFNSHEFIQVNKPRFFIFENVKGLLSDNGGKTFSEWVCLLGGKSINGLPVLFPYDDSIDYHLYWKVLNAKHHGIPQNRERVFLIGIRDDEDNIFQFPKEERLTKRLKDVLEYSVDEKYFLSEKMIKGFNIHNINHIEKNTGFIFKPKTEEDIACCLRANAGLCATDNTIIIANTNPSGIGMNGCVYDEEGIAPTLWSGHGEGIKIKTNKIRRLTPRECFRLMDFPEEFTWPVSDSQAYKQAGNSIVVNVLVKIINNLNL